MSTQDNGTIRKFETGATRDTATNKNDYEGFLSPLVIEAFGDYMNENRLLKDGTLRDSDNWQKGIPLKVYIKSGWRHFFQWWKLSRGLPCKDENGKPVDLNHAICALLFNAMGYLHETLKTSKSFDEALADAAKQVAEEKKSPGYPRFFYHDGGESQRHTVFVFASETEGVAFHIWPDEPPSWGCSKWQLHEIADGKWPNTGTPKEIDADCAIRAGVPSLTRNWPTQLKSGGVLPVEIGTKQYHKNPYHI